MAWTAPTTFLAGTALTAAQLNTYLRDNLLTTEAAVATQGDGGWFASTAVNAVAERTMKRAEVVTSQTTTSTTYADLATVGPTVSVTHGTQVLVLWSAAHSDATTTTSAFTSIDLSGSNTIAASDSYALIRQTNQTTGLNYTAQHMHHIWFDTLTAGTTTFKLKYRVAAGTGTFANRRIFVWPF